MSVSPLAPLVLRHVDLSAWTGPVALLDRDGVLIRNRRDYVQEESDIELIETGVRGLELLAAAGVRVVLVTNQACVGKGLIPQARAVELHETVLRQLGRAARCVAATYMCPHRSEEMCLCRKPRPGMVLTALRDLDCSPEDAFMVGDALSDVVAAHGAKVCSYLVSTGRATSRDFEAAASIANVVAGLAEAARAEMLARGIGVKRGLM